MKLLSEISLSGHKFDTYFTSRKRLINNVNARYGAEETKPKLVRIKLERGTHVDVVTFNFLEMMRSLLSDPYCMHDDNLTFPNDDPLQGPILDDYRNELHTGSWYKDA